MSPGDALPPIPIDGRAIPSTLQETQISGKQFFDSEFGTLFAHNNDVNVPLIGRVRSWLSSDPNARNATVNQALDFVNTAPPTMVTRLINVLRALDPEKRTMELLDQFTRHDAWINAFAAINFTAAAGGSFATAPTVHAFLQQLPPDERKAMYQSFVESYIPRDVRTRRTPRLFQAGDTAPATEVIDALRLMTGMMPPPPDAVASPARDLARESLQSHFFTRCNTGTTQLVTDYRRHQIARRRYSDQQRAHRENSDVPAPREINSFFAGAQNLGVLSPQVLEQLRQVDLGHTQVASNVVDNLRRLETETRVRESVGFLDRMEGWEKMVGLGLLAFIGMKHKKAAAGLFLTYLGVKYVGGIQDPLGSGMVAVRDMINVVRGTSTSLTRRFGLGGTASPEEVANDMVVFASREDLHGVQEEAEVLTLLNGKSLSSMSAAFNTDGPAGAPWRLNLTMLFGNRADVPQFLRNNDRAQQAAQSMAYMFFSRYREQNPADPDVRLVVEKMARRDMRCNWMQQLCKDPVLAKAYQDCVVRGRNLAAGDSRTVLRFIQDQLVDRSEREPDPTVRPPLRPLGPGVSTTVLPQVPAPPGLPGIVGPLRAAPPGGPSVSVPVRVGLPGDAPIALPMILAAPGDAHLPVPMMPVAPGTPNAINVPLVPIRPGESGVVPPAGVLPAGSPNEGLPHRIALPGEGGVPVPMIPAAPGRSSIIVPLKPRANAAGPSTEVPVVPVVPGTPGSLSAPLQVVPPTP